MRVAEILNSKVEVMAVSSFWEQDSWDETGRWDLYGDEMFKLKDRKDRDFCLGPTHEEAVVDLARKELRSYKDLPKILYQIQTNIEMK